MLRRLIVVVLALTVAPGAIAACSAGADRSRAASDTATVATSSSEPSAASAAGQAAILAYDAAMKAEVDTLGGGNASTARLSKVMTSPILDATTFIAKQDRAAGVVYRGQPAWHATVTAVDLAADPPTVTLSVCFTFSGWTPVFKSSGRPFGAAVTGPPRQLKIARLTEQHGAWRLADEERQHRPC